MAEAPVELSVEASGETVGEAKWLALRELEQRFPGLDRAQVQFQVVSEGERGILGVGYAPARVVATIEVEPDAAAVPAPPRAPRAETPVAAEVQELVERITEAIGVRCSVGVSEREDAVVATCTGEQLGLLIGKHGQTIDAIQYLVGAIVHRGGDPRAVVVDAAGYRERRQASLEAIAVRAADRVVATGRPVELEPMSPVERKTVHLRLAEHPSVVTASEGAEPHRYVIVAPRA